MPAAQSLDDVRGRGYHCPTGGLSFLDRRPPEETRLELGISRDVLKGELWWEEVKLV